MLKNETAAHSEQNAKIPSTAPITAAATPSSSSATDTKIPESIRAKWEALTYPLQKIREDLFYGEENTAFKAKEFSNDLQLFAQQLRSNNLDSIESKVNDIIAYINLARPITAIQSAYFSENYKIANALLPTLSKLKMEKKFKYLQSQAYILETYILLNNRNNIAYCIAKLKELSETDHKSHSPCLNNLGIAYMYEKKYTEARTAFLDAISLDPKNCVPYHNLARLELEVNEKKKSKYYLFKAKELDTCNEIPGKDQALIPLTYHGSTDEKSRNEYYLIQEINQLHYAIDRLILDNQTVQPDKNKNTQRKRLAKKKKKKETNTATTETAPTPPIQIIIPNSTVTEAKQHDSKQTLANQNEPKKQLDDALEYLKELSSKSINTLKNDDKLTIEKSQLKGQAQLQLRKKLKDLEMSLIAKNTETAYKDYQLFLSTDGASIDLQDFNIRAQFGMLISAIYIDNFSCATKSTQDLMIIFKQKNLPYYFYLQIIHAHLTSTQQNQFKEQVIAAIQTLFALSFYTANTTDEVSLIITNDFNYAKEWLTLAKDNQNKTAKEILENLSKILTAKETKKQFETDFIDEKHIATSIAETPTSNQTATITSKGIPSTKALFFQSTTNDEHINSIQNVDEKGNVEFRFEHKILRK